MAAAEKPVQTRERIESRADRLNYDRENGIVEGSGNVVIRKGTQVLRADYVWVNTQTEDARAAGNVTLQRGEEVWTGSTLNYNFKTRTGDAAGLIGNIEPFQVRAEKTERQDDNLYVLHRARVTTCELDDDSWHYHVRARKVYVAPDEYLKLRHGVWRFGPVPVMYVPYWYRTLDDDFGFRFVPGHSSRMGTFLLSSYRYRINPVLKGETHVDYRTKRGVAVGQDFRWRDDVEDRWNGEFVTYYADDDAPIDEDDNPVADNLDNERYRVRLKHIWEPNGKDSVRVRAHYLSDTDILEDFFEDEYRDEIQPDNYLSYTHREQDYAVNADIRPRLNDFYQHIDRIPEVAVDLWRQQIGEGDFYYEGRTAAAQLERVFPKGTTVVDDYSSFRLDSSHMLLRPDRHFGFLTVIPRVGYRGTYYTKTLGQGGSATTSRTVTNETVDAFGQTNRTVVTITDAVDPLSVTEAGAKLRSRFEIGAEVSFKAFKVFGEEEYQRRHVVEPYANYTIVPEPNLMPNEIYPFDEVDGLGEEHNVRIGARNKYQMKKDGMPFDLIDADLYTIYRFHREEGQDALNEVFLDVELRPNDWLEVDLDSIYSIQNSELSTFNTWIRVDSEDFWRASIDYRYRAEESNLLAADLVLWPGRPWSYNVYARYEFEEGRFEEEGGFIERRHDCMVTRLGMNFLPGYTRDDGTDREDELRFIVEFWLTAFPETTFSGRHRN